VSRNKYLLTSIHIFPYFSVLAGSELNPDQDSLDGQMPSGRSMLVSIEPARNTSPGKTIFFIKTFQNHKNIL
jgi:hypothetical protein